MKKNQLFQLTLTAMFSAIIIALTFIPFTGYISYGLLEYHHHPCGSDTGCRGFGTSAWHHIRTGMGCYLSVVCLYERNS